MKHHKHHEHKMHHGHHEHHGHHKMSRDGHAEKAYPGLPSHRMKYGDGIYSHLNEGMEEMSPSLTMGDNPKWRGM